jgi:uncharacterized protein YqiB (DUF1249 family)
MISTAVLFPGHVQFKIKYTVVNAWYRYLVIIEYVKMFFVSRVNLCETEKTYYNTYVNTHLKYSLPLPNYSMPSSTSRFYHHTTSDCASWCISDMQLTLKCWVGMSTLKLNQGYWRQFSIMYT